MYTLKPVLSGHSKRTPKLGFQTDYRLMQAKSIAECSNGSNLQYFQPSLGYHSSLKSLFCLFLGGCLRQVLLYMQCSPYITLCLGSIEMDCVISDSCCKLTVLGKTNRKMTIHGEKIEEKISKSCFV